jgi:hypothetical protein
MKAFTVKFEKIDAEITRVFKEASNQLKIPKSTKSWSPVWAKAGAEKRYWKARCKNAWAGTESSPALSLLRVKYSITDDDTTNLSTLRNRYDMAVKKFRLLSQQDKQHRAQHLETMIANKSVAAETDKQAKQELADLKSLQQAEQQSKVFTKIAKVFKPMRSGGISRVELPTSMYNAMQVDQIPTHRYGKFYNALSESRRMIVRRNG